MKMAFLRSHLGGRLICESAYMRVYTVIQTFLFSEIRFFNVYFVHYADYTLIRTIDIAQYTDLDET